MTSGIVYDIECNYEHTEGKYQYTGRTMKNGYSRGREHLAKYNNKHKDSMMWKHCVEKHVNICGLAPNALSCEKAPGKPAYLIAVKS